MYEPTCVHPCILTHMHGCRCRDGSRKSTLGIFLSHHPPSFWRRGLWLNLELSFLARLVGHSEPQGSFSLHNSPSVVACLHQYRKLHSGSCVPAENTSSTSSISPTLNAVYWGKMYYTLYCYPQMPILNFQPTEPQNVATLGDTVFQDAIK